MEEMGKKYQMYMNKIGYLTILFSSLLFGCRNNKTSCNSSDFKVKDQIKSDLACGEFIADTTINNKLFLRCYKSVENYLDNNSYSLVEQIRISPVAVFSNKNGDEYLLAYQYEGDTKNSFSCFEIGALSDLQCVPKTIITKIDINNFSTENNLQLGQTIEYVKKIKGNNCIESNVNEEIVLIFKIDDSKSNFLKRYNMPGYFLQITFDKTERVKNIIFGFDYP